MWFYVLWFVLVCLVFGVPVLGVGGAVGFWLVSGWCAWSGDVSLREMVVWVVSMGLCLRFWIWLLSVCLV